LIATKISWQVLLAMMKWFIAVRLAEMLQKTWIVQENLHAWELNVVSSLTESKRESDGTYAE
jgi:hypothetical protein